MSDTLNLQAGADDLASARLRREFPGVSPRIIAAVLAAYQRITPTVTEAVEAARARIMDAQAI